MIARIITSDKTKENLNKDVNGYQITSEIAKSQSSRIYNARKGYDNYIIKTALDSERINRKFISNEANILKILRNKSPNIVDYVEDFENEDGMFLVLEKINGRGADSISFADENMKIISGLYIIDRICNPLIYMHRKTHFYEGKKSSIAHGDLSPDNIMVTSNFEVKLIDFGLADFCTTPRMFDDEFFSSTPGYTSPEKFDSYKTTKESDIFALGVSLFLFTTEFHPFHHEGDDLEDVAKRISKENPSPRKFNKKISRSLESLIKACISKNPKKRPTISNLKKGINSLNMKI